MTKRAFIVILTSLFLVFGVAAQKSRKKSKSTLRERTKDVELKAETALIEAEKQLILDNHVKAYELFLVALELNPESAAIKYKLAEVLLKSGDTEKALPFALQAKEQDPTNKYYYLLYADILKSTGSLNEATKVYEELIGRVEGTEQYLFDLALLYQYQNRFDEALSTYTRAEDFFGTSEAVLLEKQKIYLKQGNLEALILAWDELIANNPSEPRFTYKLAEILISNDQFEEAEIRLRKLKEGPDEVPEADLLLSQIERKKGNYGASLELLSEPLKSENVSISEKLKLLGGFLTYLPNEEVEKGLVTSTKYLAREFRETYQAQAFAGDVLYQIGDKTEAIGYYLEAIALSPGNFSVWQNVINLEFQLNLVDSVINHSDRALEFFPNQAIFYFFNGVGNSIQKNFKRAAQSLETGTKYTSDPALLGEFYGQLGDVYNGLQENDKSDKAYEEALASNPKNDHVLNNYSYFLSLRGENMEKALLMSEKLVKMNPDNPTYLDTYGWVLYVSGNYKEAKKHLEKAVSLDGENGTIIEHYGDVLYQLGKVDEAVIQWEKASRTAEASDDIQRKITDKKIYE